VPANFTKCSLEAKNTGSLGKEFLWCVPAAVLR
jgi:hypothetical protein